MDYSKLLRKAGCFVIELITIGLIGLLVFVFLIGMWESKYLSRYKYVQGQDIKQEILDLELNEKVNPGTKEKKQKSKEWNKALNREGMHPIESVFAGVLKLIGFGKDKPEKNLEQPFTEVNVEILTPTLVKLKEKADKEDFDVEIYINRILRDYVKE